MHKIQLPNVEDTTKYNRIYINNSITEKQWHRGVIDKVSNVANIRRVQHPSVKTSSVKRKHEDNRFNKNLNDHPDSTQAEHNSVPDKPNIQKLANEENDDLDNLNKVTEQPIWTTATDIDHVKNPNSKIINKISTSTNGFDRRQKFGVKIKENDLNERRQVQINESLKADHDKELEEPDFNENDKMYPIGKPNFHKDSLDDGLKVGLERNTEKRYNITKESSKIRLVQKGSTDHHGDDVKQSSTKEEYSEAANYKFRETSIHPLEEYFNVRNKVKNPPYHRDKSDYDVKNSQETTVNGANNDKLADFNRMDNIPSVDDEETFPKIQDFLSKDVNVTKGNSMKGMWKLIKLVTDTIYKNTHRSFKSKINYLESLKATILASIGKHLRDPRFINPLVGAY